MDRSKTYVKFDDGRLVLGADRENAVASIYGSVNWLGFSTVVTVVSFFVLNVCIARASGCWLLVGINVAATALVFYFSCHRCYVLFG